MVADSQDMCHTLLLCLHVIQRDIDVQYIIFHQSEALLHIHNFDKRQLEE